VQLNRLFNITGHFPGHFSGLTPPIRHLQYDLNTCANNAGKINKLVTVFALCPCTWTVLKSLIPPSRSNSHTTFVTCHRLLARFGLYLDTTLAHILSAVSAKTRAITSLHRDSFLPYRDTFRSVLASVNAYLFYQRAVSKNVHEQISLAP
jgi:hypothetical protein